jgi:hypothetical protein
MKTPVEESLDLAQKACRLDGSESHGISGLAIIAAALILTADTSIRSMVLGHESGVFVLINAMCIQSL